MKNVKNDHKGMFHRAEVIAGKLATELALTKIDLQKVVELRRDAQEIVASLQTIEALVARGVAL